MKIKVLRDGLELTNGKVYDTIRISPFYNMITPSDDSIIIEVINEYGKLCQYYYPSHYFKDVTTEYRDDVIDGILN